MSFATHYPSSLGFLEKDMGKKKKKKKDLRTAMLVVVLVPKISRA